MAEGARCVTQEDAVIGESVLGDVNRVLEGAAAAQTPPGPGEAASAGVMSSLWCVSMLG